MDVINLSEDIFDDDFIFILYLITQMSWQQRQ